MMTHVAERLAGLADVLETVGDGSASKAIRAGIEKAGRFEALNASYDAGEEPRQGTNIVSLAAWRAHRGTRCNTHHVGQPMAPAKR